MRTHKLSLRQEGLPLAGVAEARKPLRCYTTEDHELLLPEPESLNDAARAGAAPAAHPLAGPAGDRGRGFTYALPASVPSLRSADSGSALRLGLLVLLGHLDREPRPLRSVDPVEAVAGELPANRAINPQQLLTRPLDHLVVRARLAGDEARLPALGYLTGSDPAEQRTSPVPPYIGPRPQAQQRGGDEDDHPLVAR